MDIRIGRTYVDVEPWVVLAEKTGQQNVLAVLSVGDHPHWRIYCRIREVR
jgi:hypothetical protein